MGELELDQVLKHLDDYRNLILSMHDVLKAHLGIEVTRPDGELVTECRTCGHWIWPCLPFTMMLDLILPKESDHG